MKDSTLVAPQKWILSGIWVLFLVGTLFHFLYDFSGKNFLVGLFAPVNESIWEHLKLIVIPMILWWTLYYIFKRKKYDIKANRWFTLALVSLITTLLLIPMMYYFYTGAFGIDYLIVDIMLLFIALLIGQLVGFHFYKYYQGISSYIAIGVIIFVVALFMVFTVKPPHLPIFMDTLTMQYGI